MTPSDLATMEAACFPTGPGRWDAAAFAAHAARRGQITVADRFGYATGQVAADEAEIYALGVLPSARRRGHGHRILATALDVARGLGAATVVLEVAADNPAGQRLYRAAGFVSVGRRAGYFSRAPLVRADAIIMRLEL